MPLIENKVLREAVAVDAAETDTKNVHQLRS